MKFKSWLWHLLNMHTDQPANFSQVICQKEKKMQRKERRKEGREEGDGLQGITSTTKII